MYVCVYSGLIQPNWVVSGAVSSHPAALHEYEYECLTFALKAQTTQQQIRE